ncbi:MULTISPECIES: AAA family ATPase [Mycobacterium]|uniref:AAA family ATPase n=1 Tax=Mycobacterium colombiense TaxID=339268 RepID=A0A329M7Z0_9MYCO|nr:MULTISPECIES: AAA family ATPase [Mycobacterium]MDM4138570.1 AAA family ATPase [Mycobacterium sp. FLAC0960]RAV16010.1 hypothetical protein DQP57_03845 [Mycobacterium colombiense]
MNDKSDWRPVPDSRQLMVWDILPGTRAKQWHLVESAVKDGIELYLGPEPPEVATYNVGALKAWHKERKAKRVNIVAEPNDNLKRKYAVGALNRIADDLSRTTMGTRDDATNTAIWRLGGFVNDGLLNRDEVEQAIIGASNTNGHAGGNKTLSQIVRDVHRGLDKATHHVDWSEVDWHATDNTTPQRAESNDSGEPNAFERVLRLVPAKDIESDIPDWVWEYEGAGRIQRAVLTLFAGRPEAGKSTAARWFAAQWSKGELDGCWKGQPQRIAYIAPEEALDFVVKPGLQVIGANLDNILFPEVEINGEAVALLSGADEQKLSEQLLAAGVTVVIVDPIMATIGAKVDIYRNNELRQAVAPWVRIANRINGTVVGVVHLNKGNGRDVVASVNGSSAFGEVARCVFGFAKDPEAEPERVMSQVKNSCGPGNLSLTYEIAEEWFTADSGRSASMPRFTITGESDTTVGDILAAGDGKRRLSAKMRQLLDLVNSRSETGAAAVVESGIATSSNSASKMLERLYKRGEIDNPTYGFYCPKTTKPVK